MTCRVELLCIGNELVVGRTVNTNATWLARRITLLGGSINRITTVGDRLDELRRTVRGILARKPDFLITSGGLGPTFDDMTISGIAHALDLPLRINRDALNQVKARYRKIFSPRRYRLSKFRLKMATFPTGGRPLLNPVGTAPGMMINVAKTTVICLPGVPKELRAIFTSHVAPMIRLRSGGNEYLSETISVSGVFESEIAPLLDRVMRKQRQIYVKSHPQGGEGRNNSRLNLNFSYVGTDVEKGREAVSKGIKYMRNLLAERTRDLTGRRSH